MKRFLISCTAIAAVSLVLCQPLAAQEKEKEKENDKVKITDNEEIIIKKKGDKDSKITIEIKGDTVLVNGKPLIDFDDDNIVIKKGRTLFYATPSPFRGQSGALSFDSESLSFTNDNAAYLGVVTGKGKNGVRIEQVTHNSAAEKAGLKEGDVITKIDDDVINHPDDVTKVMRKHKPEDKIVITYDRDGKSNKTDVTLGKRKGKTITYSTPHFEGNRNFNFDFDSHSYSNSSKPRLGIKAQDTEDGKGVKVLNVDDESAAEKAGVDEDDVILEFDGKKVNSADELAAAAREAKEKPVVTIVISRKGKQQTLEIKTPKKLKTANL